MDNIDWIDSDAEPSKPTVSIDFTGPEPYLEKRLVDADGSDLTSTQTDASYRLQEPLSKEATGVLSLTNRITGDFILELNEPASTVLRFIRAARGYREATKSDEGRYEIVVNIDGTECLRLDKRTLLVYDNEGNLLRQHSLIPSGVEL